jgi:nitrate reductase NapD
MNLSAILVTTAPHNTLNMINTLNSLQGVEVYHNDPSSGKIIIIQEAEAIHEEVDGLKKIKKIPGIILAEMVEHYFGEDRNLYPSSELEDIDATCGTQMADSCSIPEYLNN